jgi:predicted nucleotidyltransferase
MGGEARGGAGAARRIFPQTAARLGEWKARPEVAGVVLVGSKSRGYGDRLSDDDLEVILDDEAHARLTPVECVEYLIEGEGEARRIVYDAQYESLGELERKAHSTRDLDHWPYESAPVLFDRDGRVATAVAAAARMDAAFRHARLLHGTIDAGVAARRAARTAGRGMESASRLLLARGAKALARVLFALEWRWVPLDHWLEPELRTLKEGEDAARNLVESLRGGDPLLLGKALDSLEDRLHAEGVPRPTGRVELFIELIHPSRAEERAVHGLN